VAGKDFQVFGTDVFEVDQHIVSGQGVLLSIFPPFP
jgi:hypothetical protein